MLETGTMAWSRAGETAQREFVTRVFGWMGFALVLTGVVAAMVAQTEFGRSLLSNRGLFFALIIGELVLVIALSAAIGKMSASTATIMFIAYSALNGLTMSFIFLVYTQASIASTFFITAGTFGAMAAYGYFTKADLTKIGSLCLMGLIGIIIASVANFFFHSETIYWAVTYIGVLVFVGLTAYDTQKIKAIGAANIQDTEALNKAAIMGALALYLDFINLFLLLLRIFGRRR